jgi:hypothetical protein
LPSYTPVNGCYGWLSSRQHFPSFAAATHPRMAALSLISRRLLSPFCLYFSLSTLRFLLMLPFTQYFVLNTSFSACRSNSPSTAAAPPNCCLLPQQTRGNCCAKTDSFRFLPQLSSTLFPVTLQNPLRHFSQSSRPFIANSAKNHPSQLQNLQHITQIRFRRFCLSGNRCVTLYGAARQKTTCAIDANFAISTKSSFSLSLWRKSFVLYFECKE